MASDVYVEIVKENTSTIQICLDALVNITLVYPMTAAVFFSILCRTASQNIEQIRLKIREIITQNPTNGVNHLQQLKEFYFRNSDFIYQINRYFGVILLLDIFNNFFSNCSVNYRFCCCWVEFRSFGMCMIWHLSLCGYTLLT